MARKKPDAPEAADHREVLAASVATLPVTRVRFVKDDAPYHVGDIRASSEAECAKLIRNGVAVAYVD